MINKEKKQKQIEVCLQEVKDAMKSSCDSANILDSKAHSIINIIISIIFGLSAVIFISKNANSIIIPACILMVGVFVSLSLLYFAYKTTSYHLYGDLMKNIEEEDNYYHDEKGQLIYLIKTYQMKIEDNVVKNAKKGKFINWAIITAIISAIISVIIYINIQTSFIKTLYLLLQGVF